MSKDRCPHCGGYCLSRLRRSFLGPISSAPCRSCGERVGVPYWSAITVIPIIVAVAVIPQTVTEPHLIALITLLLALATDLLNQAFVPLVKK